MIWLIVYFWQLSYFRRNVGNHSVFAINPGSLQCVYTEPRKYKLRYLWILEVYSVFILNPGSVNYVIESWKCTVCLYWTPDGSIHCVLIKSRKCRLCLYWTLEVYTALSLNPGRKHCVYTEPRNYTLCLRWTSEAYTVSTLNLGSIHCV